MVFESKTSEWVETVFPYKPVQLTDEDWAEIKRYSNLPDTARSVVGRAIALYRDYQANVAASKTAAKTRSQLIRLGKDLRAACEVLQSSLHRWNDSDARTWRSFDQSAAQ